MGKKFSEDQKPKPGFELTGYCSEIIGYGYNTVMLFGKLPNIYYRLAKTVSFLVGFGVGACLHREADRRAVLPL
jgi:hypothetical protein